MPSSTSNSDLGVSERPGAERPTASDRPGVAQPVPERPVPAQPWRSILLSVLFVVAAATTAWEWRMQKLQLLPGDIDDTPSAWAENRRRVDAGGVTIAIIGDSRILYGTDPDRFEALTGIRPLQLAIVGTNARFLLENLADDSDFNGLLIIGTAEQNYFSDEVRRGVTDALGRYRFESPAQRSAQLLHVALSRTIGFLDDSYRLSRLVQRLDTGWRSGTRGPYDGPWKLGTNRDERNIKMWSRIELPGYLRDHQRTVWLNQRNLPPMTDALIADTQRRTRDAVEKIRAHGGEVVFLRPPTIGPLWDLQEARLPRARGWDALLREAHVRGVHFLDDPAMQGLDIPEYSHVSAACAPVYTDAYVRALARITNRLSIRPGSPAPLHADDCRAKPAELARR